MSLPRIEGPVSRRQCDRICGPHPFNCHDHMKVHGNGVQLYGSAGIHSLFGSLERPYKESIGLGSYTDQKSVVLEGEYTYQFLVGLSN